VGIEREENSVLWSCDALLGGKVESIGWNVSGGTFEMMAVVKTPWVVRQAV